MYYVLYSPNKGYFVAEATTVEQADQYIQNSYFESMDRNECQSYIETFSTQDEDYDPSDLIYDYDADLPW
jgi:hypothetical protein